MGHVSVMCYALTIEVWLPETCIIALFLKVVSEMEVILWPEWKPHKFTPCCTNYEV